MENLETIKNESIKIDSFRCSVNKLLSDKIDSKELMTITKQDIANLYLKVIPIGNKMGYEIPPKFELKLSEKIIDEIHGLFKRQF